MKKIIFIISFVLFTSQTFACRTGGEVGNGHMMAVTHPAPPHTIK